MDKKGIIQFAQDLVRIPSQGGIDCPSRILDVAHEYSQELELLLELLYDGKEPVAIAARVQGKNPGKTWCLNACIDTAPIGNKDLWEDNPFSGKIVDNHLYGRGAADSKIAVSMFIHLAKELQDLKHKMHGDLVIIFDADEHTGQFRGIKEAIKQGYKSDGVMIGYPGDEELIVGARGFSRYEIVLHGKGGHSGSHHLGIGNRFAGELAKIIGELSQAELIANVTSDFPKQPQLTVTEIYSGDGFSVIPSKAVIKIDVRLTPAFNQDAADQYIQTFIEKHRNLLAQCGIKIDVKKDSSQPAFFLEEDSEIRKALSHAAKAHSKESITEKICSPSNIGCYLSGLGIEATAGFGVPYKNMHAPNESADLNQLEKVYSVYRDACKTLLSLE